MLRTISILIAGQVQGVYYRQSAKEKASELGITGTVQNLADSRVYIRATGTDEQLDTLVEWCWEGPRRAKVMSVEVEISPTEVFRTFTILRG